MTIEEDLDGASLLDSAMHATIWGRLQFVPVALWIPDGWNDGVPTEPLKTYSTAYLATGVQPNGDNLLRYANALWVRARIPIAFGVAPPTCRRAIRWRFLNMGFLAVSLDECVKQFTPFVCTDRDLQAELRFGPTCHQERREAISAAFWGLLASAPCQLASYRDRFIFNDGHDINQTISGYWRGYFHLEDTRW